MRKTPTFSSVHPPARVTATTRRWGGLGHHLWTAQEQGVLRRGAYVSWGGVSRDDLGLAFCPLDAKKLP